MLVLDGTQGLALIDVQPKNEISRKTIFLSYRVHGAFLMSAIKKIAKRAKLENVMLISMLIAHLYQIWRFYLDNGIWNGPYCKNWLFGPLTA